MLYLYLALTAAGVVAADQIVKSLIVSRYAPFVSAYLADPARFTGVPQSEWTKVLPGVVHLTFQPNDGAAFSILSGQRWFFLVLTVVYLVLVVLAVQKKWVTGGALWALAAVTGGAIGNFIDRMLNGFVVDMIEVEFMHFAVFNVADCFITCGAIVLMIFVLLEDRKSEGKHHAADA